MNAYVSAKPAMLLTMLTMHLFSIVPVAAQTLRCDPAKVMTAESCGKCHSNELQVWQATPHYQTFEELNRRPRSKEICENLGLRSVKRSGVCIECHYTAKEKHGKSRPISGISCESCHGAAQDWIQTHSDYGGPTVTRQNESPDHRLSRLSQASAVGMRNTQNLYLIASSCLQCHTVPNEELVNIGGHHSGSKDFELVSWSQGRVRHNFLRSGGETNAFADLNRLRVMYVVGLIADLEFSTRATAQATAATEYGLTVAERAATVSMKLYEVQQQVKNPTLQSILVSFSRAELRISNGEQLSQIADEIRRAGLAFAVEQDGTKLNGVDEFLPDPATYR